MSAPSEKKSGTLHGDPLLTTLKDLLNRENGEELRIERSLVEELVRSREDLYRKQDKLAKKEQHYTGYIRAKTNQLLNIMGTKGLRPEELDDQTLLELDPIGIIALSFQQVLEHLQTTNQKLRDARDEIGAIFDSVGVGIMVLDHHKAVLEYNTSMQELFHSDTDLCRGKPCRNIFCRKPDAPYDCAFDEVIRRKQRIHLPNWQCRDHHFDVVGTPIFDEDGEISQVVLVYMDISERIQTEEGLRRARDRARSIFQLVPNAIFVVDTDKSIIDCNRRTEQLTGYSSEELIGKQCTIFSLSPCGRKCNLFELPPETDMVCCGQCTIRRKDGTVRTVFKHLAALRDDKGKLIGGIECFEDITDRLAMENELGRIKTLESMGVMAGGLAHDFNNLLTAILGNVELAKITAADNAPILSYLESVTKASLQARELTRQLLTFSRGGAPVKSRTSLNDLIRDCAGFTARGTNVRCDISLPPDLQPVEIDTGQISQVFQNLILNACQAMPEGGVIRIRAKSIHVPPEKIPSLLPGSYVAITVTDNGNGISEQDLSRIFDPYFTTKDRDSTKGTGLGLTICHSIIQKHGGAITVQSTPGQGSTFTLYLPAAMGENEEQPRETTRYTSEIRGREKILVMDDEPLIRELITEMLSSCGYEVECATDGDKALDLYRLARNDNTPFQAVILDLTVPGGMGGKKTLEMLKTIDPDVVAIVSSGYSDDPVLADFTGHGFSAVLSKPFDVETLCRTVREAMENA